MDKNEVITLSSDEESDYTYRLEQDSNSSTVIQPVLNNYNEHLKLYLGNNKITKKKNLIFKANMDTVKFVKLPNLFEKNMIGSKECPEFVDLVESVEKPGDNSQGQFQYTNLDSSKTVKQKNSENHSKLDIIEIDEIPNYSSSEKKTRMDVNDQKEERRNISSSNIEINENSMTGVTLNSTLKRDTGNKEGEECKSQLCKKEADEDCNQNLKFFTEFVEYCGSLEKIPNDRARLTKKLMKRYGEADSNYIKSQEFQNLIQKCKDKVNLNNLYLIAKEVTDELNYRKKIDMDKSVRLKTPQGKFQSGQKAAESIENAQEVRIKQSKKRSKIINQIIIKLDKLGSKIRELEGKEVDLSDEEESSYVQLQRYRERFCQIYKKLCKYTSEVIDPNTIYNPKICFTESKYPAINKCIETWLNRTRRFPDFSDILKLLESQSSSLGLPSSRELIRTIAIEIFQQVGAMLQRKRIYDLWDSLCEFLGTEEDPANNDPILDQVLKSNFEVRIKKEQEIFQHFSELQEKERLEPEEVPDEEANRSPIESGSEDDRELEGIENSLHRKLDDAIKKDAEINDNTLAIKDWDGGGNDSGNGFEHRNSEICIKKSKESKNNFRNCKSLKWRSENYGKMACLSTNSEDSNPRTENDKEKKSEVRTVENFKTDTKGVYDIIKAEMIQFYVSPKKRAVDVENENSSPKKKCTKNLKNEDKNFDVFEFVDDENENASPKKKYTKNLKNEEKNFDVFEFVDETVDDNLKKKTNGVFNVNCCHIFTDNVFEDLYEKKTGWIKRKVFRDLTNVNRLMELHGKRKKISGLYSPSFFHRSFLEFEKSSWKNKFRVSFKLVGSKNQKCALNGHEKSGKTVKSNSAGDTEEKKVQNNSETGREDECDNFFSGHGNGSEEGNDEDKNKKNGRTGKEVNENQLEEEEDEENDDENNDNFSDETGEKFFQNQKTEKQIDSNQNSKIWSNERVKTMQWTKAQRETLESESTNKVDDEKPPEKVAISEKKILDKIQKNSEKKVKLHSDKKFDGAKKKKKLQSKGGGNIEIPKGKINLSETGKDQSEVKTSNNMLKDERECVEVEELKPVDQKKEKESNIVVCYEASSTKTNQQSQDLKKIKIQNPTFPTDNVKDIVNTTVVEEAHSNRKGNVAFKKNENKKAETLKRETPANRSSASCIPIQVDLTSSKFQKRNIPSTSDEERVKRFLLHSPSSISITPPRKLSLLKPPSQAALQALATLRNLKGISATIVRSKPKTEDEVVVIGGSFKRHPQQDSDSAKRRRTDLPVISSVQSIDSTTPKIVTVQGNVTGFDHSWQEMPNNGNTECNSSSIRISNVWGSLPNNSKQSGQQNESVAPGCSSRQTSPGPSGPYKKKSTKKAVEYVVLD